MVHSSFLQLSNFYTMYLDFTTLIHIPKKFITISNKLILYTKHLIINDEDKASFFNIIYSTCNSGKKIYYYKIINSETIRISLSEFTFLKESGEFILKVKRGRQLFEM